MKSHVQTSFLNRAGCWTQLFALTPGLGPSFLGFLSLTGFLSPKLFQSRRTRLRLIVQPRRANRAWIRRYPYRGCRRANRLISRFKIGSSARCFRRYRRPERDRPMTREIRRSETPYRSSSPAVSTVLARGRGLHESIAGSSNALELPSTRRWQRLDAVQNLRPKKFL
jgi:hypothetical protein